MRSNCLRWDRIHALAAVLEKAFAERDADTWEAELTERGIGCLRADEGPYARFLYDAPWSRELGHVVDAEGSAYGAYRRFGRAVSFAEDGGPLGGARRAGENPRPILAELGYGSEEVARLFRERIVAEPEPREAKED